MKKIVFAGGGTAGHIEPALAVARVWKMRHPDDHLVFLGTSSGLETQLVPAAGFELSLIPRVRIPRKLTLKLFLVPITLISAIHRSREVLQGASLLIGFGGYVSAPAYIAAKLSGIPIVIHEANAKPGLANKVGAVLSPYRAIAQGVSHGIFSHAQITGIPMRQDIAQSLESAAGDWIRARNEAKKSLGFKHTEPLVLVVGGSQGAKSINESILEVRDEFDKKGIQIFHALGMKNDLPVAASPSSRYRATSYIKDMGTAYLAADLIIARSGAVTCSEINALGRYALFIPLSVGNGEQKVNALALERAHRAQIIDQRTLSGQWLIANIDRLLEISSGTSPEGSASDVDAGVKIVNLMENAISGGSQ